MTFTVGQRVRVRRPDSRTQVRTGDFGSIVSTSYNSRGETYRVRLERAIDRTPRQTPEAGDYTFEPAQLDAAPARGPRDFVVGDRVILQDGARTLADVGVTLVAGGTEAVIDRLGTNWSTSGSPAAVTVTTVDGRWTVSLYADQIRHAETSTTERNPTVAVGDRVTCVRATNVDAAAGRSGVVTYVDLSAAAPYIRVRFDESVTSNTGMPDTEWYVDEWTREAPAAPTSAPARAFRVGDRVRLRDGARTLRESYITDPIGTEGEVVNTRDGDLTVRTDSNRWYINRDQAELIETPASTFTVGQRVRLRDGSLTLRNHSITSPAGTEAEITRLSPDWETTSSGTAITVRVIGDRRSTWYVYRDQIEPVETPAPAEIQWVPATAANAVAGARIRYTQSNSPRYVDRGDVGVIVHVSDDATTYNGIKILMDTPREYARLTERNGHTFHWGVALRDIEVAAPAVERWIRLNERNDDLATGRARVGRRVRYSGTGSHRLVGGDLGTVADYNGSMYQIRMDEPRGQRISGTGTGQYHWTSGGSDFEVCLAEAAAPTTAAETYSVVEDGTTTTWTVGARIETVRETSRDNYPNSTVTTALAYRRQESGAGATEESIPDYYRSYVFFEYDTRSGGRRITGFNPSQIRQIEAGPTPTPAETPTAAAAPDGEVTFTPAQRRAIAQMARRYADRHGYADMVDGILTELNAEDPALNRRRVRLTIAVDVEVEGVDGYSLPTNDADLRAMIRNQNGNQIIDAALNRRLRRVGDATVGDRGITFRD